MSEASVLIVGAGALGLTCGYHLRLAGAEIGFLVRPHRRQDLERPQKLYCYNDHHLKTLEDYRVFTDPDEVQGQSFDFVLLTLDGATCRSEQGEATLGKLGQALAGSGANLIINAVGIGLYDHVKKATGWPEDRLLQGTMGMFAYQVGKPGTPEPPSDSAERHDSADVAYLNFPNGSDFIIAGKPAEPSKAFLELFNRCGVAKCKRIPLRLYETFTNAFVPFIAASDINGWQGPESVMADQELWELSCHAQREIMGMKRNGLVGKLFALMMTDNRQKKMIQDGVLEAEPMGYTAFNRFHHGGKVREQNMQILANLAAAGDAEGRDMKATKTLLARWREKVAAES